MMRLQIIAAALLGATPAQGYYYGGGWGSWGTPCTSCSQACQDYNDVQAGEQGGSQCMESTYSDTGWGGWPAWCSSSCNVAECDRQGGTCSIEDALGRCVQQDEKSAGLKKPARTSLNMDGSIDAKISMRVGQLKVQTTQPPDPTKLTMVTEVSMSWKDQRWSKDRTGLGVNQTLADCRDVLPAALKIPSKIGWIQGWIEQAKTESAYYIPKMSVVNPMGNTPPIGSRTVSFNNTDKMITTKVQMLPTFSMADFETDTPYYAFPFDVHTLYAIFEAKPAAVLQGCNASWLMSRDSEGTGMPGDDLLVDMSSIGSMGLAAMSTLLPASGDWNYDEDEVPGPQVAMYPGPSEEICIMRFRLRRNPTVYTLKAFVPDLIVMCIAMASLFMNPQIPPLFGGRMSTLILSILITMNSSLNRNNGLGRLSYLLKIDFVALINLALLLVSVALSVSIHLCFRFNLLRVGLMLDRAVRMSLPSVMFPGLQLFLYMFLAQDSSAGPVTFLVVYLGIALALIITYYVCQFAKETATLAKMAKKLKTLDLKDPNAADILREAFILFDADKSGALDAKEGKKLLRYVNPKLGREKVAMAIRAADRAGSGIVEDDFQDMISKWATIEDGMEEPEAATTEEPNLEVKDLKA